jgi:hypothetical protein
MLGIDYKTDISKHYVRRNGWLPACRNQVLAIKRRLKKAPLRYFTFCAADAIDVFMLEREKIIQRHAITGRLEGVFFCERNEDDFGKIADLIGSPEQGFQGDFERIVLFEDDHETLGKELYNETEEAFTEALRKKLRHKDAHARLRREFPFDIINLDVCGVMFPPRRGVIAPLLRSVIQILKWQTEYQLPNNQYSKQFTLFLTSHVDPDQTDREAIEQLSGRLSDNISAHPEFRSAFANRYGHEVVGNLVDQKFAEFFCLSLPKYIIHYVLFELGWEASYGPIFLYNRPDRYTQKNYQMMHSISTYKRIEKFGQRLDQPNVSQYVQAVTRIIESGMTWVEPQIEIVDIKTELETDLVSIVNFRDQSRGIKGEQSALAASISD